MFTRYKSVQLSQIRNLNGNDFDYLIAVFFDDNYDVFSCVSLRWHIIGSLANFQEHTNAHILRISPTEITKHPEAEDLTKLFTEA